MRTFPRVCLSIDKVYYISIFGTGSPGTVSEFIILISNRA